jgi:hypothetical protein
MRRRSPSKTGVTPRIHLISKKMDRRVKPGDDKRSAAAPPALHRGDAPLTAANGHP